MWGEERETHGVFLLVHHVVVHFGAEDAAVIEEPGFLHFADFIAHFDHVPSFCDAVEEGEAPAYFVVNFSEDGLGRGFSPVLHAVVS